MKVKEVFDDDVSGDTIGYVVVGTGMGGGGQCWGCTQRDRVVKRIRRISGVGESRWVRCGGDVQ